MLEKNSKVSVVILLYNSDKYIEGCLRSLKNQTYRNNEIIIIDNASKKNPEKKVKDMMGESEYIYIRNDKNVGYATGNNIGIEKSTGEYILLLNPDIILENDYIEKAVRLFKQYKNIGSITGKILKYKFDNKNIVKTDIIDTKGLKIFKTHRIVEIGANTKDKAKLRDNNKEIFGVSAAAGIYRKKALNEIKEISYKKNYFDDIFFIYKEDIDLAWRLRHSGWKSFYISEGVAYHDRWETGSSDKNMNILSDRRQKSEMVNYYSYRNHKLLLFKNQFFINLLIYAPFIFYYEMKKFIYLLLFEQKTLRGFIDNLRLLPLTLRKRNAILSKSKLKPSDLRRWF